MIHPNAQPDDPLGDPRNFVYIVWGRLGLPDPTPLQYEIVEFLAFGPDPSRPRNVSPNNYLIAEAFRGAGKSWLASALDLWELHHDPTVNSLVVSATAQRGNDFSRFCHRLVSEIPELEHLRPNPGQRDSGIAWDVGPAPAAHAPSCRSLGVGGQLTGSRADVIMADDVEILANSATEEQRQKLRAAFAEFTSILKPHGRVLVLGTPQTEQTVYKDLEARGYYLRRWPSRIPTEQEANDSGIDTLAPSIVEAVAQGRAGEPVEPSRFPNEILEEKQARLGRSAFRTQFQLDTSLSDALRYPLRLADLVVADLGSKEGPQTVVRSSQAVENLSVCGLGRDKPSQASRVDDWAPYDLVVTVVDPAGRGKDEAVAMALGGLGGNVYLLGAWATQDEGYSDASLEAICRLAARYGSNLYLVESNFGDGAFGRLLGTKAREIHPGLIEEVRHHQQKEARIIETLEPVMNQGRLIVSRRALEWDARPSLGGQFGEDIIRRLTYQMARITTERGCLGHDDRLDCLAMGVRYLLDQLKLNPEDEVKKRDDEAQMKDIRKFLELADGVPRNPPGWGARR